MNTQELVELEQYLISKGIVATDMFENHNLSTLSLEDAKGMVDAASIITDRLSKQVEEHMKAQSN